MPAKPPNGQARFLNVLSINSGWSPGNPDVNRENSHSIPMSNPTDTPGWQMGQIQNAYFMFAAGAGAPPADHPHFFANPNKGFPSDPAPDQHSHHCFVTQAGNVKWSIEREETVAAHGHVADYMNAIDSLGNPGKVMRPKYVISMVRVSGEAHAWLDAQVNTDPDAGTFVILSERELISGDNTEDPTTWEFEDEPPNDAWGAGARAQIVALFESLIGETLPDNSGDDDIGINDDRRLMLWLQLSNSWTWKDISRFKA